jgi:hypothetical protein
MRRNFGVALGVAVAASILASAAIAGPAAPDQVSSLPSTPGAQASLFSDPATPAESAANLQDSYDHAIIMLKKKMDRLTREDGGQLSAAHQASLQKELDDVNRRFRLATRF